MHAFPTAEINFWNSVFRFECEKLILVGDPKQLPPTIQASEAAHENGLEQTLFDRLCLMVLSLGSYRYRVLIITCRLMENANVGRLVPV